MPLVVLSALALEACLGLLHRRDVEAGSRFRWSSPAWRSDTACGLLHPPVALSPFMFLEVHFKRNQAPANFNLCLKKIIIKNKMITKNRMTRRICQNPLEIPSGIFS